jgi:signal transduction histidine kinase
MRIAALRFRFSLEQLSSLVVLAFLLAYTYAYLVITPYYGFHFNPGTGVIDSVYPEAAYGADLRPGDQWLRIGPVTWEDYKFSSVPFQGVAKGETVSVDILRDGQLLTIPLNYPGFNLGDFYSRFINVWWSAYMFWFFGVMAAFLIRPQDQRWGLLVAFYHITALWLMAGSVSAFNVGFSRIVMRSTIWLSVPVYLHFHWIFPRPLRPIPGRLVLLIYLSAVFLAVAEWFRVLPSRAYLLGFLLAVCGSLGLLLLHTLLQPTQRRELRMLTYAAALAILPVIALALAGVVGNMPWFGAGAILPFGMLPAAYFFIVYRRQLGGLSIRTNRRVSLYIYFIAAGSAFTLLAAVALGFSHSPGSFLALGLLSPLLATLLALFGYPRFQRWFERSLHRMPIPPTHLEHVYSARITTSLDTGRLVGLIRDELLPTLLVRQAALLRLEYLVDPDIPRQVIPVFILGVTPDELPRPEEIPALLAQAGAPRPPSAVDPAAPCPWARLVLALSIEGWPVGLCLLGCRDPDDVYASTEIPTLQTLMDQTALALTNIEQARRLHALYQADIGRMEEGRRRLALELHDVVLRQLAILSMSVDERQAGSEFLTAYETTANHIRQMITLLRPTMLNYGLYAALQELADETATQVGEEVTVDLAIPPTEIRLPEDVELHLFRMVQEACQNAARHAQANTIRISGGLEPQNVEITVHDDGRGFEAGEYLDLLGLLARKHFGLAGMFERAALIGAQVTIQSTPHLGTQVRVTWKPA